MNKNILYFILDAVLMNEMSGAFIGKVTPLGPWRMNQNSKQITVAIVKEKCSPFSDT